MADESSFYMELGSFLREISCPYKQLSEGPLDERFKSVDNKLILLDFLLTELQASRIVASEKPHAIEDALKGSKQVELNLFV